MPHTADDAIASAGDEFGEIRETWSGSAEALAALERRLDTHLPELRALFTTVYGDRADCDEQFGMLVADIAHSAANRPAALVELDARREEDPDWFQSRSMLGGVCYVDRYAGDLDGIRAKIPYFQELGLTYLHLMPLFLAPQGRSDGGYAVSSYRQVDPRLGDVSQLRALADELRDAGIALVLDFVFNHTSNEHEWARKALEGDPEFEGYYWIFPDRELPDAFDATTREIFPDDHRGSFVQLEDGRWVWATFRSFQWDLNYSNPAVFRAMAREMLFIAEQGVEILRMDAVAFIWKQLGTACESLPMAHTLLRAFNAVCRIAAPSLIFKSEAIVHPDEVARYIDTSECQLSYNPLQMALTWEALATRSVGLLSQALERRHAIPAGTAWVNYVRSHDDIGWTFSNEDAAELGIEGYPHRRFLNDFYTGRFDGSFAQGIPFQENPDTGDTRICGTTASLTGLEQRLPGAISRIHLAYSVAMSTGGIPLLYLGDEVGQLNDYSFADDPDRADDSRWAHRPVFPTERYAQRTDPETDAGLVFAGLQRLVEVRRSTPEFDGNLLHGFGTNNPHVLGYQRPSAETTILVLANFADTDQLVEAVTLSGFEPDAVELTRRQSVSLAGGLRLRPHEFAWLRVRPRTG